MKSLLSYKERGPYGDSSYRGNTSGKFIIDLHKVYQFNSISDYMCGSNTTAHVSKELKIESHTYDLNMGFDLINNDIKERNECIFWHPPYWDIIQYSGNVYGDKPLENDLSHIHDYSLFMKKINYCLSKQFATLEKGGRLIILTADVKKSGALYSMLLDMDKLGTLEQIIVKEQHNCLSDKKSYKHEEFIRIAHETALVLRRNHPYMLNFSIVKKGVCDLRDSLSITWKDLVATVIEKLGKVARLEDIYKEIEGHKKCNSNKHWKEKIRQTLQINSIFTKLEKGVWGIS
ncbi:DNA modification methylase [Clostridioides sp. ES-S-0048-02]|uniref:DNA modification methylase n=1 Tax=Clostridioides sp. ES-S-0048-02 TaxID=2770777 RepID=UPI001D119522|nr:DNA modification methylase [Clostridioides sp. ES-S-0048-02]